MAEKFQFIYSDPLTYTIGESAYGTYDDDIEYIRKKLYKGGSSHDRNNDRSGTRPTR